MSSYSSLSLLHPYRPLVEVLCQGFELRVVRLYTRVAVGLCQLCDERMHHTVMVANQVDVAVELDHNVSKSSCQQPSSQESDYSHECNQIRLREGNQVILLEVSKFACMT